MPSQRKARAARRRTFDVINPATGKALANYPILTAQQVRTKVEGARDAFRSWSRLDPKERAAYLLRFVEVLRKHKEAYAETMTLEMGKVIREAIAEVEKCAWAAEYFGEDGPALLLPELVATDAMRSYIAVRRRGERRGRGTIRQRRTVVHRRQTLLRRRLCRRRVPRKVRRANEATSDGRSARSDD